jgi:hypothetical protein
MISSVVSEVMADAEVDQMSESEEDETEGEVAEEDGMEECDGNELREVEKVGRRKVLPAVQEEAVGDEMEG